MKCSKIERWTVLKWLPWLLVSLPMFSNEFAQTEALSEAFQQINFSGIHSPTDLPVEQLQAKTTSEKQAEPASV